MIKISKKKLGLMVVTLTGVIFIYGSMSMKAATQTSDLVALCKKAGIEISEKNKFINYDLTTEEAMTLYHKRMNERFNEYIKKMITSESEAAKNGNVNPDSVAPEIDQSTLLPKKCSDGNYSTYCVADKLLNDEKEGYLAYAQALECRRSLLFDSSKEEGAWNDYIKAMNCLGGVCSKEKEQQHAEDANARFQAQKALMISSRLEAISREQSDAKIALDQTLSAYNELRTAWPMHKKYMEIYKSLLKYRDKMVEIRQQVEQLPGKFINVSTTKCT